MRTLFDNPVLLLVAYGIPLVLLALGLLVLYWVVRLAVRHGVRDAGRRTPEVGGPPTQGP